MVAIINPLHAKWGFSWQHRAIASTYSQPISSSSTSSHLRRSSSTGIAPLKAVAATMPTQTSFSRTFMPPFFDNVTNFSGNPDPFVSAFIETVPTPAPFFDSLPSSSAHPPSFPAGPAPSSAVVTSITATLPSAMQGFTLGILKMTTRQM